MPKKTKSPFYGFHLDDLFNLLKVAVYSGIASFLGVLTIGLENIEVTGWAIAVIPAINIILVAIKDYFDGK